jgi:acyl-CoA reductase-like NAD-dependent aldehyde dehydrogenase
MHHRDKFYIGGKWIKPLGTGSINVVNASTEQIMGSVPEGNEADAKAAVAAARTAFDGWSTTSISVRSAYLRKIQGGLHERASELAELITGEVGMPLKLSAQIQVGSPIANFGYYAQLAEKFEWEEVTGNSRVIREPAGVAACITPWNSPLQHRTAKGAAALAAATLAVI